MLPSYNSEKHTIVSKKSNSKGKSRMARTHSEQVHPVGEQNLEFLFSQLGLSQKALVIYTTLLQSKGLKVASISQKSAIKRGTAYVLLAELEELELIEGYEKSGVQYYRATSPENLLTLVERRRKELLATKVLAEDVVKDLKKQWKVAVGRPVVQYYEGREGIQKVFADIYAPKDEPVYGCVDLEVADTVFPEEITEKLIPIRIQNKLFAYTILGDSPLAQEVASRDSEQCRSTRLVAKEEYPFPAEIDVYEDKIAMLSFDKGDFVATIIENRDFAQTLRSIFKLAFDAKQSS